VVFIYNKIFFKNLAVRMSIKLLIGSSFLQLNLDICVSRRIAYGRCV